MRNRVAIVGSHPETRNQAPWDDLSFDIWVFNEAPGLEQIDGDGRAVRFVKRCGDEWGVPITWLEYMDAAPRWREVTFETASRDGEPFEALIGRKRYWTEWLGVFSSMNMTICRVYFLLIS